MTYAINQGVRIFFDDVGEGEPVILVPGLGMTTATWDDARTRFGEGLRTLAVDPRGAGRSDKPDHPYDGALVAADLVAVLDAAGIERAHLVGMSMGGMIAQEVAIRHPEHVRSLVLVSSYAAVDDWSRRIFDVRRSLIQRESLAEHFRLSLLFVFSPKAFRSMRDWIDALERRLQENPPDVHAYLRQLDFCAYHDASSRLGAVTARTLVMTGAEDLMTSRFQGRELAELIPSAEYHEVPEASHALVWEEPDLFVAAVREFVLGGDGG